MIVNIDPFIPAESLVSPSGSTHYRIVTAAMDVNFESAAYSSETNETPVHPIDTELTQPLQLSNNLNPDSTNPLFLVLGINFYQEVNGSFYEMKNGSHNALQIVKVSGTP